MAEGGGTQYLLRLGLDTGLARPDVDALNQSLTRVGRTADEVLTRSERSARATDQYTTSTTRAGRASADAARSTDRLTGSQRGLESSLSRTTQRLLTYAAAYVGVRQAVRAATSAVGNFSDIESGLIGVRKTTDLALGELTKLHQEVLALATGPVPLATTELLELAQVSGQLGIRGREDLLIYVETLGQLSAATDVVGAEGAKNLARLLGVNAEAPAQLRATAAALTALGNDARASEAEILNLATEVGLGTAQFQIGSVRALAFATAMAEMGIRTEMGGTAIGRTMREIQKAVFAGGEELQAFADAAQVSADEFAAAFEEGPTEAFLLLFEGLSARGQDATIVLDQLGLGTDRLAKVLPILAEQYDVLEGRMNQAHSEAADGTALVTEASRAFDQTSADLARLRNAYKDTSSEVGRGMSPAIRELALEMRDYLILNREAAASLGQDLGKAVKAAGEIILFLARNVDLLQAAVKALIVLKLAQWLSQGVAWLQAYSAANVQATATTTALGAAVARNATIWQTTALPTFVSHTTALATAQATTATTAGTLRSELTTLTTGGIRPLTVGLTGVLGVILLLNEAAKSWGDRMDREIRRILELSQQFGERTRGVQDEAKRLLDAARFQREFEAELLREGISDPQSDQALQIRERMEADLHRSRVDRLLDWKGRLTEVHDEMGRVAEEQRKLESELPRARAGLEESRGRVGRGRGDGGLREFQEASAEVERLEQELKKTRAEFRDLNTEQTILQNELPKLTSATEDYMGALQDVGTEGLPPVTDEQKKAAQEFRTTLFEIQDVTAGIEVLVDAYASGPEAVQTFTDSLELENRLRATGIDLTTEQAQALGFEAQLRKALAAEIDAERRLAGAETIASLDQQIQAQAAVNEAFGRGAEAVALARREQKLSEEQSSQTADAHKDQAGTIQDLVRQLFELAAAEESLEAERDLTQQRDDFRELLADYEGSIGAVEATRAALAAENEIRRQTIDLVGEERERRLELAAEVERLFARTQAEEVVKTLEDQLKAQKDLQEVRRSDFLTERAYQEALRQVNFERELEIQLVSIRAFQAAEEAAVRASTIEGSQEQADALRDLNDEYEDLIQQAKKAAQESRGIEIKAGLDTSTTQLDAWVSAAREIADALRDVDEGLADIADSAVDVLASFEGIGTAAGNIDFAVAAGNLVAAVGKELSGPNNFAAEGSLIGAIVGGIIGGIVTSGNPAGVQAGAAIGSAAGGALGSFVKKGADEFIAEFKLSAEGGLDGVESKVEGEMGSIGRRYMEAVERGIEDALDQLGAFLIGIPDIGIKVREGMYSVTVGAAHAIFGSMEEAVDFAILQLLRQGDIIGLSPEVQQAIENSTAESFQGLMEDIDFAKWFGRLPEIGQLASESANALFDAVDQYQAALRKANELGFETDKIDQWFVHVLDAIRKNVLGIVETNEERIRREAEGFNLAVQLLEAEQRVRQADLLMRKAELKAELELLAAKEEMTVAELLAEAALIEAQGSLVTVTLAIAAATAEAALAIAASLEAIDLALSTIDSILENLPELISEEEIQAAIARAGGGGGQRKREREEARREIEDLRLLASGLSESALSLRRELEDFDEWMAAARKLGIAEADLAQARLDNLQLLEEELMAPFEGVLSGADPANVGDLLDRYVEALEQAAILAAARAEAAGTTAGEEFARLADVLAEAFGAELADALSGSLPGLIASGDVLGLEDLRASLLDLAASLPPSLAGSLADIAAALGLIDQAIATMEALGLGGPIAGVDTSSIQDYLDMALGISEVDRELRDLQLSFLAVLTEARLAGASQEDLALIRDAYGEALEALKDSVLDSVREYLDAAQGIGEFERQLLDLQQTFRDTRRALAEIEEGESLEDVLFGDAAGGPVLTPKDLAERSGEVVAAQVQEIERVVVSGLERIVEEARRVLGVEGLPGDRGDAIPGGRREPPPSLRRPDRIADDVLDRIRDALDDVGRSTDDLTDEMRDLEEAERRAIRALGVDFIGSLEDLGVALPVELTLELAQAQFALAQAEAISSALALAAAGAFDGLSISLVDLLDLIAGASFGDSTFAPRAPRDAGGGRGGGREQDALDGLLRRVEEQLRAWDRAGLGDATTEAIALAESLVQVRADAQAAGVSIDRVSESYQRAVSAFVDASLAEFEDMDLSPLEAELQSIQDRFVDLLVAFEVAGASAEDMLRLEEAFTDAMADFLERATSGIRAFAEELRASDPRRTPEQRFLESQAEFQDLLARAQGGDLEAIEELEAAARDYREEALAFLGFGVGSQEVLDLILAGLDSIEDVELVPEDIALLREQAERLLALIDIAEAQPTRDSTDDGFDRVRDAVDDGKTASESLLDLILSALEDGQLEIAGIGDLLDALGQIVTLTDLSGEELDRILAAVSGVVDVADSLGPEQLESLIGLLVALSSVEGLTEGQQDKLFAMVTALLGLETLSDAQRDILEDILGVEDGNKLVYKDQMNALNAISTHTFQMRSELWNQGDQLDTAILRLTQIREAVKAIPQLQTGGFVPGDGLAFLHAGELVLNPGQTNLLTSLTADLRRRPSDRLTSIRAEPPVYSLTPALAPQREGEGHELLRRAVVELRQAVERGDNRRADGEQTAAKLAAARLRQGGGELELLSELSAEVAALRRQVEKTGRGLSG